MWLKSLLKSFWVDSERVPVVLPLFGQALFWSGVGPLSSKEQEGKDCHDQDKQVYGLVLRSFLAPETDMIFGDGVGASLLLEHICNCNNKLNCFFCQTAFCIFWKVHEVLQHVCEGECFWNLWNVRWVWNVFERTGEFNQDELIHPNRNRRQTVEMWMIWILFFAAAAKTEHAERRPR